MRKREMVFRFGVATLIVAGLSAAYFGNLVLSAAFGERQEVE